MNDHAVLQMPFDTFCFLVAQYKQCGTLPPGASTKVQQWLQNASQVVELRDGKLCGHVGKSLRHFITGEKARLGILRKAHVRKGWYWSSVCSSSLTLTSSLARAS
jgi:hypothetical protein